MVRQVRLKFFTTPKSPLVNVKKNLTNCEKPGILQYRRLQGLGDLYLVCLAGATYRSQRSMTDHRPERCDVPPRNGTYCAPQHVNTQKVFLPLINLHPHPARNITLPSELPYVMRLGVPEGNYSMMLTAHRPLLINGIWRISYNLLSVSVIDPTSIRFIMSLMIH